MTIAVLANSFHSISGGDVIFSELALRWIRQGHDVRIYTNTEGKAFCLRRGISTDAISVWHDSVTDSFGAFISQAVKTLTSVILSFSVPEADYVFSISDFFPDVLPAAIMKYRYPKSHWLAACYVFYPLPGKGQTAVKERFFSGMQRIALSLVRSFGDALIIASRADIGTATRRTGLSRDRVYAIEGGVDFTLFQKEGASAQAYDAVFVGRFHEQKNIEELISVWELVLNARPGSRLALIGEGHLGKSLKGLVRSKNIIDNVHFLGRLEGAEKIGILKASKVFVSASVSDSGNIALVEAMACGIPGVIYDLPKLSFRSGVVRVATGNKCRMAQTICMLLSDEKKRRTLGGKARKFAGSLD